LAAPVLQSSFRDDICATPVTTCFPASLAKGDLLGTFISACNGTTMFVADDCECGFHMGLITYDQETAGDAWLYMGLATGAESGTLTICRRGGTRHAAVTFRITGAAKDWDGLLECCCTWPVTHMSAINCWDYDINLTCSCGVIDIPSLATGCTARDYLFLIITSGGLSPGDEWGACCPTGAPTNYTAQHTLINNALTDHNNLILSREVTSFTGGENPDTGYTISGCFYPGTGALNNLLAIRNTCSCLCFNVCCICCAPTIATSAAAGSGTVGNTFTVCAPASVADCDLLIVIIDRCATAGPITQPSGWTSVVSSDGVTNDLDIAYKIASGEGASWDWLSTCCTCDTFDAMALRITGSDTCITPTASTVTCTGGSFSPATTSVCVTCGGSCQENLFLAILACATPNSPERYAPPAGYTLRSPTAIGPDAIAVAFKKYVRITSKPSAWTASNNSRMLTVALGIKQASTGPAITSLCPTTGVGGNSVVIAGSGFTGAINVRFGGKNASFTVDTCSQITTTAPNQGPGAKDVFVKDGCNTENTDDGNNNFTYLGGPAGASGGGSYGRSKGRGKGKGGGGGGGEAPSSTSKIDPAFFVTDKPGSTDTLTANIANSGSTTRQDGIYPSCPGKALRVIGVNIVFHGATSNGMEFYFGDGTNLGSNAGKEVSEIRQAAIGRKNRWWPIGAGPIGGPGERLSFRGTADVDESVSAVVYYREEPTTT